MIKERLKEIRNKREERFLIAKPVLEELFKKGGDIPKNLFSLLKSNDEIAKIASLIGFSDINYFKLYKSNIIGVYFNEISNVVRAEVVITITHVLDKAIKENVIQPSIGDLLLEMSKDNFEEIRVTAISGIAKLNAITSLYKMLDKLRKREHKLIYKVYQLMDDDNLLIRAASSRLFSTLDAEKAFNFFVQQYLDSESDEDDRDIAWSEIFFIGQMEDISDSLREKCITFLKSIQQPSRYFDITILCRREII